MVHYHHFLLIEKPNTINIWLEAESHPTNGFAFRKVGIVHLNQLPHTYQNK
jgi:hypothetical protein